MTKFVLTALACLALPLAALADEPTVMTDDELDQVRAGDTDGGGGGSNNLVINMGTYSLVYDGTSWDIVFN